MEEDPQGLAVRLAVSHLIPSAMVTIEELDEGVFFEQHSPLTPPDKRDAGMRCRRHRSDLWFRLPSGRICRLELTREGAEFSPGELQLLRQFPLVMSHMVVRHGGRSYMSIHRLMSSYSFDNLLVARYVRGQHASTFLGRASLIDQLQRLTYVTYEGHPATSGFVFTPEPARYVARVVRDPYAFQPFSEPIHVDERFFLRPASYRYVDGANAFYLVDSSNMAHGVIRSHAPESYSRIDRAGMRHIEPLVRFRAKLSAWVAFVGSAADVNVVTQGLMQLKWSRSRWSFFDRRVPLGLLAQAGVTDAVAVHILEAALSLSAQRLGYLLLVLEGIARPQRAGYIDGSALGRELTEQVRGETLGSVLRRGSSLGLLSSDGLMTITADGAITDAGEIIVANEAGEATAGGGRTQAALAASAFGTVVKVSQDGPMSIFRHGRKLLEVPL